MKARFCFYLIGDTHVGECGHTKTFICIVVKAQEQWVNRQRTCLRGVRFWLGERPLFWWKRAQQCFQLQPDARVQRPTVLLKQDVYRIVSPVPRLGPTPPAGMADQDTGTRSHHTTVCCMHFMPLDGSFHFCSFYRANFCDIFFSHSTEPESVFSIYEGIYERDGANAV